MNYILHKEYEVNLRVPEALRNELARRAGLKQNTLENEMLYWMQKGLEDQTKIHQQLKSALDHFLASRRVAKPAVKSRRAATFKSSATQVEAVETY